MCTKQRRKLGNTPWLSSSTQGYGAAWSLSLSSPHHLPPQVPMSQPCSAHSSTPGQLSLPTSRLGEQTIKQGKRMHNYQAKGDRTMIVAGKERQTVSCHIPSRGYRKAAPAVSLLHTSVSLEVIIFRIPWGSPMSPLRSLSL